MFDIGVNWSNKNLFDNYQTIIKEAIEWGVNGSIAICNSGHELKKIFDVQKKVKNEGLPFQILHTLGYHPMSINELDMQFLENNISGAVAVGECGLDYNRMYHPKEQQLEGFRNQIELARKYSKPLYCHERMAINDFMECIGNFSGPVVIHCCSVEDGDNVATAIDKLNTYISRGYNVGFTTYICKKTRADSMRKAIKHFGPRILDYCMVETDAPYMSPPDAPRINTPAWVTSAVQTLSELLGILYEECDEKITANTRKFFGFS